MGNRIPKTHTLFCGLSLSSLKQLVYPEEKFLINCSEMMINIFLKNWFSKSKSDYLIKITNIVEVDIEKMKEPFDHLVAVLYLCLSIRIINALRNIGIVAELHKD